VASLDVDIFEHIRIRQWSRRLTICQVQSVLHHRYKVVDWQAPMYTFPSPICLSIERYHTVLALSRFVNMKSTEEVIQQFNETVNMSAEELESWLKDPQSKKAGTGVGLESGKRIKEILKKNPSMDPNGYDEVASSRMIMLMHAQPFVDIGGYRAYAQSRRVRMFLTLSELLFTRPIRYNKRHLTQEDHLKETKTKEELENAKSTIR
jgi:hypothetical protein